MTTLGDGTLICVRDSSGLIYTVLQSPVGVSYTVDVAVRIFIAAVYKSLATFS